MVGFLSTCVSRRLRRSGARWAVALSCAALTVPAVVAFPRAAMAQASAKALLDDGDKAAKAKDWTKALDAYAASNKAQASADALEGVANAHYQLKHDGDAYSAYAEWLKLYGDKAAKPKKATAEARLKELEQKTGTVSIAVNESGAAITIDDKPVGTSPLAGPVRVAAGPHRIRVAKDGFVAFDQVPNVSAGAAATVDVKLEAQTTRGRLVVKSKDNKPIRVIVDGIDRGDAPWSGELEAGVHDVSGRSPTAAAATEKVTVERGKTHDVELVASTTTATLKIATSDGRGLVYLDGKLVGEGSYQSEVPAGPHKIKVTREGYDSFEEEIVLKDKESTTRSVTLNIGSKIETGPVQKAERTLEGIYGGFGILGTIGLGGTDSTMQKSCGQPDIISCDTGSDLGGGVTGFIGFHWDPIGVELALGAHYDQQNITLDRNAVSTDPGFGPDPARVEEFAVRRTGGHGALRIRYTVQGEKIRFSVAAGVGLSHRLMFLVRDTVAKGDPSQVDKLVQGPLTYWSPVLSVEPSVYYRLSGSVSVGAGLSLLVENPTTFGGNPPRTEQEGNHRLGPNGLTSPSYELASGAQVQFGPFIGMMFGP